MYWPFVIWSLPRSRTAWLQAWLGGPSLVGHDHAVRANSIAEWLDFAWHGRTGMVETGGAEAAALIRLAMPGSKFVVLRRPVGEVVDSLRRNGVDWLDEVIPKRDERLAEIAATDLNCVELRHSDLADVNCCAWLFEHLTGLSFDFNWWQLMSGRNVQVDMLAAIAEQAARADQIARLRREVQTALTAVPPPTFTRIGLEPLASLLPEAKALLAAHQAEVFPEELPGRPYEPDEALVGAAEARGACKIVTARANGRLVGYLLWTIGSDPESRGVLVGNQGPWFVERGRPGVGPRMLDWSLTRLLPAMGVRAVDLHHNLVGRGRGLGRTFQRLGAVPYQMKYSLELSSSPRSAAAATAAPAPSN